MHLHKQKLPTNFLTGPTSAWPNASGGFGGKENRGR
jgi:hypothetical protein